MAQATNTEPGTILLSGDLTGNNAYQPILAPTGVTAGTYTTPNIVVNSKGRLLWVTDYQRPPPGNADYDTLGVVQIGAGLTVTDGVLSASIPDATTSSKGLVQIGTELSATNGVLSIADATASSKGIAQIDTTGGYLSILGGVLSASIPDTTTSVKGLVQIGTNISVTSGVISLPNATTSTKGVAGINSNSWLNIDNGTLTFTLQDATTSSKGVVQIGSGLNINSGILSVQYATDSQYGVAKFDINNIIAWKYESGTYSLDTTGVIKFPATRLLYDNCIGGTTPSAYIGSVNITQSDYFNVDVNGVLSLKNIDGSSFGAVKPGGLVSYNTSTHVGTISIPDATTGSAGIVQIGSGLSVTSGVVSLNIPDATTSVKGVVQIGSNISVSSGVISIANATTSSKGVIQTGTGLISISGVLSASAPDATTSSKGIVQVGSNLAVNNGIISTNYPDATTSSKGLMQAGTGLTTTSGVVSTSYSNATAFTKGFIQVGSGLSVTGGVVSLNTINDATTSVKGVVQVGTGFNVDSGTVSAPDATTSVKGVVQIGSGIDISNGPMRVNSNQVNSQESNSFVGFSEVGSFITPIESAATFNSEGGIIYLPVGFIGGNISIEFTETSLDNVFIVNEIRIFGTSTYPDVQEISLTIIPTNSTTRVQFNTKLMNRNNSSNGLFTTLNHKQVLSYPSIAIVSGYKSNFSYTFSDLYSSTYISTKRVQIFN